MTQSESVALKAADIRLSQAFNPDSPIVRDMLGNWLSDIEGDTNGSPSTVDQLHGLIVTQNSITFLTQ